MLYSKFHMWNDDDYSLFMVLSMVKPATVS